MLSAISAASRYSQAGAAVRVRALTAKAESASEIRWI